jgi:hypothetical protein
MRGWRKSGEGGGRRRRRRRGRRRDLGGVVR